MANTRRWTAEQFYQWLLWGDERHAALDAKMENELMKRARAKAMDDMQDFRTNTRLALPRVARRKDVR